MVNGAVWKREEVRSELIPAALHQPGIRKGRTDADFIPSLWGIAEKQCEDKNADGLLTTSYRYRLAMLAPTV